MPRFYFHFRDGEVIEDAVGEVLPDLEAARHAARRIVLELEGIQKTPNAAVVVTDGQRTLFEIAIVERRT